MDSLHVVRDDQQSDVRDGMRIDWNVPIEMDDGVVLRADVFRPVLDGRYPPILSCGPYGKGVTYEGARGTGLPYALLWDSMRREFPEIAAHSSNKYQVFETIEGHVQADLLRHRVVGSEQQLRGGNEGR